MLPWTILKKKEQYFQRMQFMLALLISTPEKITMSSSIYFL